MCMLGASTVHCRLKYASQCNTPLWQVTAYREDNEDLALDLRLGLGREFCLGLGLEFWLGLGLVLGLE